MHGVLRDQCSIYVAWLDFFCENGCQLVFSGYIYSVHVGALFIPQVQLATIRVQSITRQYETIPYTLSSTLLLINYNFHSDLRHLHSTLFFFFFLSREPNVC